MADAEKIPIEVVLADSNKKKSAFLESIKKELSVSYVVLKQRSEDINRKFDIITARAVTSVKSFLDLNIKTVHACVLHLQVLAYQHLGKSLELLLQF